MNDGPEPRTDAVSRKLHKLPAGWHALHRVSLGELGEIDHLVIGPAGVFTLDSSRRPSGRIWIGNDSFQINGREMPYLCDARAEARRASALLTAATGFDVQVAPVIVVAATEVTRGADPVDVHIVYRDTLVRWLTKQPTRLSEESVAVVYERARWDVTWTSSAPT